MHLEFQEKNALRKKHILIRKELDYEEKKSCDLEIAMKFLNSSEYKTHNKILAYVSSDIEVDTRLIIDKALKDGKELCVPRCVPKTNIMNFYKINSFDDLKIGNFKILEPKEYCVKENKLDNSLCIVPALSYDLSGYRLGYGKGFYDRFLSNYCGKKIGLCYQNCITDKLCNDEFDVPVDFIITEKEIIKIDN